jgi:Uma2 family endonuclease
MSTVEAKRTYTPQDLLRMPDSVHFELVDGELVERNVSVLSSLVEGLVYNKLQNHSQAHNAGHVWPGTLGLQCFPDAPNKIRKPDSSFVPKERFASEHLAEGFLSIAPDLAVEVVSPGDLAYEVDEKVEEYLAAGVSLVWVINPETRIVEVHRKDGSVSKLREVDELTGENVLPGFRCRVAELFPPRA